MSAGEVVYVKEFKVCQKKFGKDNIGLYRDDGLSVFKNHNSYQKDKVRKEMIDLFK